MFLDARVKPEHDKKKNKSDNNNYLFVIPVLDQGNHKGDIRVKPEYDRKEAENNCRKWQRRKISPLCDLGNGAEVAVAVNLNDTQLMVHFFNRLITVDGRISVQNTVGKSLVSSFGTFGVNSRQTVVVA